MFPWRTLAKNHLFSLTDRRLVLDPRLGVSLSLVQCYDYVRLDVDGVPPIAVEAVLDYVYEDKFSEAGMESPILYLMKKIIVFGGWEIKVTAIGCF